MQELLKDKPVEDYDQGNAHEVDEKDAVPAYGVAPVSKANGRVCAEQDFGLLVLG